MSGLIFLLKLHFLAPPWIHFIPSPPTPTFQFLVEKSRTHGELRGEIYLRLMWGAVAQANEQNSGLVFRMSVFHSQYGASLTMGPWASPCHSLGSLALPSPPLFLQPLNEFSAAQPWMHRRIVWRALKSTND